MLLPCNPKNHNKALNTTKINPIAYDPDEFDVNPKNGAWIPTEIAKPIENQSPCPNPVVNPVTIKNGAWIPTIINNVKIVGNSFEKLLPTAGGIPAGIFNCSFSLFSKYVYSSIEIKDEIIDNNNPFASKSDGLPYDKIIKVPRPIKDAINVSFVPFILAKE